jgi:hypothetical protein
LDAWIFEKGCSFFRLQCIRLGSVPQRAAVPCGQEIRIGENGVRALCVLPFEGSHLSPRLLLLHALDVLIEVGDALRHFAFMPL